MTTLFRSVQITSAEQAEALPEGTSVKRAVWHESGYQDYYAGVKIGFNTWFTTSPTAERQDALSSHMVGWTALVPIEAEEEHAHLYARRMHGDMYTTPPRQKLPGPARRLVTPWEEA